MFTPVRTRRTFEEAAEQIADGVRNGRAARRRPAAGRARRWPGRWRSAARPCARRSRCWSTPACWRCVAAPDGGMFVATDVVPAELVRQRSTLRLSEVAAVLEARRLVEPGVARLAAERAADDRPRGARALDRGDAAGSSSAGYGPERRGSLPPARRPVPPRAGASGRQPDRRAADADALPRAGDRARHGDARAAGPRVDDRRSTSETLAGAALGRRRRASDEVMDATSGRTGAEHGRRRLVNPL